MEFGVRKPDGTFVPWSDVPEAELVKMMDRVSGNGPGEVSPEEMVDDLIDDYGEDIEYSLKSELEKAQEAGDEYEIGFWKAAMGYLARRTGDHIRSI